jgi:ribosomal protein S27AE
MAKLTHGEARRVPAAGPLVGYYLGCAACGRTTVAAAHETAFQETTDGLTMAPVTCSRCGVRVRIDDDEMTHG